MSAELCDTSTDEDIYINYLLVNKGFAVSTGQRYEFHNSVYFLMFLSEIYNNIYINNNI